MDNLTVGNRIREARLKKKFTQEQIAEKVKISTYHYGQIERGEKNPSLSVFVSIADALGVSSDYLLRDELSTGNIYVNNEITQKLDRLTAKQRAGAVEILDAYIKAVLR